MGNWSSYQNLNFWETQKKEWRELTLPWNGNFKGTKINFPWLGNFLGKPIPSLNGKNGKLLIKGNTNFLKPGNSQFLIIFQGPTKGITSTTSNDPTVCNLKGRHDPCIAIRGSVVCEAMTALVLADMLLLNLGRRVADIDKIYNS